MELTQGVLQWEYLVKPISIYIIVWVFRLGGCAKGAGGGGCTKGYHKR